jgi:hypothetical protein
MLRNIIKARSARAVIVLGLAITAVPGSGAAQGASLAANEGPTGCQPTALTPVPQPTQAQLDVAGLGNLPLAPNSALRIWRTVSPMPAPLRSSPGSPLAGSREMLR